jgi:hypothetical protein
VVAGFPKLSSREAHKGALNATAVLAAVNPTRASDESTLFSPAAQGAIARRGAALHSPVIGCPLALLVLDLWTNLWASLSLLL